MEQPRVTVPAILERKASKRRGEPLVVLTAYDATMARIIDSAGVDVVLVGDSLGMVVQGERSTLGVTIEEMIYHTHCVSRAVEHALVVADMPFGSYHDSIELAVHNACRLVSEGGAAAVKLEGGVAIQETIARLVALDIPVMGHVGMTPQSIHRMGGFRVQGRAKGSPRAGPGIKDAGQVMADAVAVVEAGAFSLVLECVPASLGSSITKRVAVPTIGIGAGPGCDGQVLVCYDMLGMLGKDAPRFVKKFGAIGDSIRRAVSAYAGEVRGRTFPADEHTFSDEPGKKR